MIAWGVLWRKPAGFVGPRGLGAGCLNENRRGIPRSADSARARERGGPERGAVDCSAEAQSFQVEFVCSINRTFIVRPQPLICFSRDLAARILECGSYQTSFVTLYFLREAWNSFVLVLSYSNRKIARKTR
jgi:hypothetical protein